MQISLLSALVLLLLLFLHHLLYHCESLCVALSRCLICSPRTNELETAIHCFERVVLLARGGEDGLGKKDKLLEARGALLRLFFALHSN